MILRYSMNENYGIPGNDLWCRHEDVEELEEQSKQLLEALVKIRDHIYEELDELIIPITGKKPEE